MNSIVLSKLSTSGTSIAKCVASVRNLHLTTGVRTSVFMKRQKKIDPEVAKQREARKRRKLEKEIRAMQKHSKKPKPVDEMTVDIKSMKNIDERYRTKVELSEAEIDERAVAQKEYTRSRGALMRVDDAWIRESIAKQDKALNELKKLAPELYEAALRPDVRVAQGIMLNGPANTPPLPDYQSPDGDYIDTTRSWV
uniref:Large ribosomal subunit protein mL40 n=1 Tax=Ascaris lumbricoides TaxID=6252 RepID=A0A0M3I280_ASCLU